eukprot:6213220-Pleurochrysis_carterae.AAC.5
MAAVLKAVCENSDGQGEDRDRQHHHHGRNGLARRAILVDERELAEEAEQREVERGRDRLEQVPARVRIRRRRRAAARRAVDETPLVKRA